MIQHLREMKIWKRRPVIIFLTAFFVLLLALTVRLAMPVREYAFESTRSFEQGVQVENVAVYEGISLGPGVYHVELDYETEVDTAAWCDVYDGTVFTGGLLSNGEPLYSALERTGYDVWLYEATESFSVVISFDGEGSLTTGALRITETKGLWTMLLVCLIFAGAVIYASFLFYYYDRTYGVPMERKSTFFCVTVIALLISLPFLCGYNEPGADLTYHLRRIEGVKDGLLAGQFPVRIEPRWLYEHGYADAIFYCNALLYFPAFLRMAGFPITASYNLYCIGLNFAAAWIAYFCFGRIFRNRKIGIICSALYTLSIFRIYKLIITGAAGEGSAVTFMPLVLYGMWRIFTENPKEKGYKTAWIPMALGYAGLMQTHVLSCEITALVTVLFCVLFIRKIFCRNTFLELAKGALAAVLLSLWFLVPFLDYYVTQDVHIKHVSARTIQDRGLYLAQLAFHFWTTGSSTSFDANGMQYSHPVGIGLVLMAGLAAFLILWFSGSIQKKNAENFFGKATAVVGVLLLWMSLNVFPWDRIQSLNQVAASLVSSIQFPNRFLGWGTVCLVFVFGFCMRYFEEHARTGCGIMAVLAVIAVTTSSMYLLDYVNANGDKYELYNEEGMGLGYISGAEYLIEGTNSDLLTFAREEAGEGVEVQECEMGSLRAEIICANSSDSDSYIDVPLLLYKGYRASDTETGENLEVCAGENNVVRVILPAHYSGSIEVKFVSPIYWRVSEIISAVSAAAFLVIWRKKGKLCVQNNRRLKRVQAAEGSRNERENG